MPYSPEATRLGLAKEATAGTYVSPTLMVPVEDPRPEDRANRVVARSIDYGRTATRAVADGPLSGRHAWRGLAQPEVVPVLLNAAGLVDTVTGTGPYTHTMKLPTSGNPPTYSITDYNGVEARSWSYAMLDTLSLSIDPSQRVTYEVTWAGMPSVTASTPAATYTVSSDPAPWSPTVTLAGAVASRVLSLRWNIATAPKPIHTFADVTKPTRIVPGVVRSTGSFTAMFENTTDTAAFLNATKGTLQVAFGTALTLKSTAVTYMVATVDRSGTVATVSVQFEAEQNATDNGPMQAVVVNNQAGSY